MLFRFFVFIIIAMLSVPVAASSSRAAAMAVAEQGRGSVSAGSSFWMHGGVESWSGDITYRVGYPVTVAGGQTYYGYFPFSELEFPLDSFFGVLKVGAVLGDRFVINAQVKKDISDPDDDMVNRSWTTPSRPWQLDVYSKYEVTDFSGLVLDGDLSYKVLDWDFMWLAVGAGYMYQNFEYETAFLHQWSPSGLPGYDDRGDGTVSVLYEVDFTMPYILFSGRFDIFPEWKINARLAIAPWVEVEDRDRHLLRNKENVGDQDGSAVMVSIDTQYDFTPQLFMRAGLEHTAIEADGDMRASFDGVYDHTLTEELDSRQTSVFVTLGFKFGAPDAGR